MIFIFLLTSCVVNPISSDSNTTSTSSTLTTDTSTSSSSGEEVKEDENGFIIIDENTLTPPASSDNKEVNKAKLVTFPSEIPAYSKAKVYINGVELFMQNVLVNLSQTFSPIAPNRANHGIGYLRLDGKAKVTIRLNYQVKNVVVRPLDYEIEVEVNPLYQMFSFEVSSPGKYVVEINGNKFNTLYLIVGEYEKTPIPSNARVFNKGIHNIPGNYLYLNSNEHIYLDDGAVLRAGIIAYNANNISISGFGIIDGSTFDRNATTGSRLIPIDISRSSNILIKDISVLDSAGWTFNMYFDNEITIDNVNIITSRANGDGISLQSCTNAKVINSFLRTWDDSLVVKNYPNWDNKNIEGSSSNILFENCYIITDLAQSLEIGYETIGSVLKDVTFKDITIMHNYHKPVLSIHNGNNANIRNIKYQNITVEDGRMGLGDGVNALIDINVSHSPTWSNQHKVTPLGDISGVYYDNIKVLDGNRTLPIKINGSIDNRSAYLGSIHQVSQVELKNIEIYGETIDNSYSELQTNEYSSNISITSDNKEITGHKVKKTDVSSFGDNYQTTYS